MHSVHYWGAVELAQVERLVRLTNAFIELQRDLIEHLYQTGDDLSSAKLIFDDLFEGLSSCVAYRQQLREIVSAEMRAA